MSGSEFHAVSPTGAILTKFWTGGYKPAYAPLTDVLIAAKSPAGVVFVRPEGRDFWSLPGGPLNEYKETKEILEAARKKFKEQAGISCDCECVLGHFRMTFEERIEYGVLVFCTCRTVRKNVRGGATEARAWNFETPLAALDPVAEALATVALCSRAWKATK